MYILDITNDTKIINVEIIKLIKLISLITVKIQETIVPHNNIMLECIDNILRFWSI